MDGGDEEEGGRVERDALAKTKTATLRLLALLSFLSLMYSYFFSGLSSYYNIQFSTLIFSLFAHAMDRKYVFLICNGIVAFLVKSLSFTSSSGVSQTPPTLVQEKVEYGVGEEEETDTREECSYGALSEEEEDEDEDNGGVDEDDKGGEGASREEEVSTEELNHKFEEFIKKMKEEIRIEAEQPLIAV
ncbi:uncharacterized protein LOC121776614 [Salvia splendens]|uniref:uncharacterized protein LOC121776614 n=1 Tax=Salvia splendens TaxID=180675 RepID=UPI001C256AF1|nr:uncharacterized protein LOC121776614 [Salvia splendens]